MTDIKNLNEENFENEVLKSQLPVIVDFWAEWCGPCKMLTPILEEVSDELKDKILIVKINLDENQELAMKYSIRSIPTLLLFNKGNLVDTKVGLLPKDQLVPWIQSKI
ncbi:MAG: thioredoxin [Pseudomonadota bacterium]|nr:thioredoxin [Pseudomonadota bacterium]